MAAYGDMNGRYVQEETITGPRYNLWAPASKESKTSTYQQWGRTSGFISDNDGINRDHVCRPVLVDAQGRRRPIVAHTPNNNAVDNYITTTETITEHVIVPGSPIDKDYRGFNNGQSWPAPAHQYHQGGHHDGLPRAAEAYISKIQGEASRPITRPNPANSYGGYGYSTRPSDSSPGNINNNRWNKPARDPYFDISADGYYQDHSNVVTEGGWARPSRPGWSKPASNAGSLSHPTNNIGAAIDYIIKDTAPATIMPKVHTYGTATVDSSEAKRRYGGFPGQQQTIKTTETIYSPRIDSTEAARRYRGEIL